ncbi:translocation/assembly module TamB domain-containing protein [Caviibacter abscessus]|uniref:translocation/assembly module TamB domain-containing protein n=1 Tax=Caviibacter abscessus TaxID=1766719 RepID=UPI000835C1DE|nr:hypothetical protein [Caviibacter abscessus]
MKKAKINTILITLLLLFLTFVLTWINIDKTAEYILDDIMKTNVKIGSIKFEKYKIVAENIELKDLSNEYVGFVKKAYVYPNPFLVSRVSLVKIKGGNIVIKQGEDWQLNLSNILRHSKTPSIKRVSNIGIVTFEDINATYINTKYEQKIEKSLGNVHGMLISNMSDNIKLSLTGEHNNEKMSFGYTNIPFVGKSVLSLFSFKDDKDKSLKDKKISLGFENATFTQEAAQFLPFELYDAKLNILNGNFDIILSKNKEPLELYGNLKVECLDFKYKDYDKIFKNITANVKMNKHLVDVNVSADIEKKNVSIDINSDINTKKLNAKIKFDELPYEYLNKYSLINKQNLNLKGNVSADILFKFNLQNENKLEDISGTIKSKNIEASGINLENIDINLKNGKLKGKTHIVKKSSINIDELLEFNLNVDFNKMLANGRVNITNFTKELELDKISVDVEMKSTNKMSAKINSNQISGLLTYDNNKITLSAESKKTINFKYNSIDLSNNFKIKSLVYDTNNKKLMSDIDVSTLVNGYDVNVKTNAKIKDNALFLNSDVIQGNSIVKVTGNTNSKFEHNYNINGNLQFEKIMEILGIDKKIKDANKYIPLNFSAVLTGKGKDLDAKFNISSNYINYISEFQDIKISGNITNILKNPSALATINTKEIWKAYHRLKNISANISYENKKLLVNNIQNEHLSGTLVYNLDTKSINADLFLNKYMVYTTNKYIDINTNISKLHIIANGKLNDLEAKINLGKSFVIINGVKMGYLVSDMNMKNSILYIDNMTLDDNNLKGTYDFNSKQIDINVTISQQLQKILNTTSLKTDIQSTINFKGTPNNVSAYMDLYLKDISYKSLEIPNTKLNIEYTGGNITNLFRTGILNVKEISIQGKDGANLFKTNAKFNLANLNLNYDIKNKEFDLSKLGKEYDGKIQVRAALKGNLDDYYAEIMLNSSNMKFKNNNIKDLTLSLQANKDGINIGQGYFEYQNNPVLIEGYIIHKPLDYDIRVVAKDFDLSFLKLLNSNISQSSGMANIDFVANKNSHTGSIKIDNFNFKTKDKDYDISKFNVDLSFINKDINFNKFNGLFNGGTVNISGSLTLPNVSDDFMQTRRLKLGKFDLNMNANNMLIKYKGNKAILTGDLNIKGENITGNIIINSGTVSSLSLIDKKKNNNTNVKQGYIDTFINEVINNLLKQYLVTIDLETSKPIVIDVPTYLVAKNIMGELSAKLTLIYENGLPHIYGDANVTKGSFDINNNVFSVEQFELQFLNKVESTIINPYINLRATTRVGKENIEVSSVGFISEKNIQFKSDSGKSRDEILELLTFRGFKLNTETGLSFGKNVINIATETAVNQLFSPITNMIGKTIGLTKFDINANIEDKDKLELNNLLNNTSADIYLQSRLIKNKEIYWNTKASLPFNGDLKRIKYDLWISYLFKDSFGANIGIKGQNGNEFNLKNIHFYGGINYSKKFDDFSDFFDNLSNIFDKRETLK